MVNIPGQVCLVCFADMFVPHLMKQHENANAGELSFQEDRTFCSEYIAEHQAICL